MADSNDAPRDFPITVTVDGRVRVTVVLTLKAGVEVAVKETKVEPTLDQREQVNDAPRDSALCFSQSQAAADSKSSQVGSIDSGQRVPDK